MLGEQDLTSLIRQFHAQSVIGNGMLLKLGISTRTGADIRYSQHVKYNVGSS